MAWVWRLPGFASFRRPGGSKQETAETVHESLGFSDSLELDSLKATMGIRIYPETELAAIAVTNGIISPDLGDRYPYRD